MSMRRRAEWWTDADTTMLLRAWTEASDAAAPRLPTTRAVCARFQQLSPVGSNGRSEHAIHVKHKTMLNVFDTMWQYIAMRADDDEDPASDTCAARVWFALSPKDRRSAFAALNQKSYQYVTLSLEHYRMIAHMKRVHPATLVSRTSHATALSMKSELRDVKVQCAVKPFGSSSGSDSYDQPLDSDALALAMARTSQQFHLVMARLRQREHQNTNCATPVPAPAPREPPQSNDDDDAGGSSTESEDWDEIVPRSPVCAADDDDGDCGKANPMPAPEPNAAEPVKRRTIDADAPPGKRACVSPELLDLAAMLETQMETLHRMVAQARDAQVRDREEREALAQQLQHDRVERRALLDRAHSRLCDVERQRAEWAAERDRMQREWGRTDSSQR